MQVVSCIYKRMNNREYEELVISGRELMKGHSPNFATIVSGEKSGVAQLPLVKEAMGGKRIDLSKDFDSIIKKANILDILNDRKSRRVYKEESLTIEELSFLLWATQGVKKVVGKERKASFRMVPSAGAKHPIETYIFVKNVEGLEEGLYHYLALDHQLEFIEMIEDQIDKLTEATCGQVFFGNSSVSFIWTVIPYRTEWRYTVMAQKYALIDVGHVCQNLYIACEAIGCGTCAIGAYEQELMDELLHLETAKSSALDQEFVVYAASVGKAKDEEI